MMKIFNKKKEKIVIETKAVFKWTKGLRLQATEKSAFYVPGAIFQKGIAFGEIMELSSNQAEIMAMEEQPKDDRYPDIAVILEKNVTMKLNKNCEVILLPIKGEMKKFKEFIVAD